MNKEKILEELTKRGFIARFETVVKNGTKAEGIVIGDSYLNPIIYTNQLYPESDNWSVTDIVDQIIELYYDHYEISIDEEKLSDPEYILKHLYVGMQRKSNEENLILIPSEIPNMDAYLLFVQNNGNNYYCFKIKKWFLDSLDIATDKAISVAIENVCKETIITDLSDVINIKNKKLGIYVITNRKNYLGASSILNKGQILAFGKMIGVDKFICLPSSIHEWLLVPYNEDYDALAYEHIIRTVNTTQVAPNEQLGNEPYVLDLKQIISC